MEINGNQPIFTKKMKTVFVLFISISLVFVGVFFSKTNFSYGTTKNIKDIHNHWAKNEIYRAISKGFVQGYPDGTFKPDKPVTRAEFTTMINKALKLKTTDTIFFKDVPRGEWYYQEVQKGLYAAFVGGYRDNTFKPNAPITRQEACVMLSRIVPVSNNLVSLDKFSDKKSIAPWALDGFLQIVSKKYINGYDDGKLHPLDKMTRAQTAKIIGDILDNETIYRSVSIEKKNTTISNTIYTENVTVDKALDDDSARIRNCTILGKLYVYGGGENTVKLEDTRVSNSYIKKPYDKVRLLLEGKSSVVNTTVENKVILETSSLKGGIYGSGFGNVVVKGNSDSILKGDFVNVNVDGYNARVDLKSSTIKNLNISRNSQNATVYTDKHSLIKNADVQSSTSFQGYGVIQTLNAKSNHITYENKPVKINKISKIDSPTYDNAQHITIYPRLDKENVSKDTTIELSFGSRVYDKNRKSIKNGDINDLIKLRKGSTNGSKIIFYGSIDASGKTITLNPKYDLEEEQKYYVIIDEDTFFNSDNVGNKYFSSHFYTGDKRRFRESDYDNNYEIEVYPKNNADNISRKSDIRIYFDKPVRDRRGGSLSRSEIEDIFEIREKTKSGKKINFKGEINSSKKTVTLDPRWSLKDNQKYYIIIPRRQLKYDNGEYVNDQVTYFYTGSRENITYNNQTNFYPYNNSNDVAPDTKITITFNNPIETKDGKSIDYSYIEENVILRRGNASGSKVDFDGSISSNDRKITLTPKNDLENNTLYYVSIPYNKFRYKYNNQIINSASVIWTVRKHQTPTVTFDPVDGASNVPLDKIITLTFSENLYVRNRETPTKKDLQEYISIRKDAQGSNLECDIYFAKNNNSAKVIIDPDEEFEQGYNYTISIVGNRFKNEAGIPLQSKQVKFRAKGTINNVDLQDLSDAISEAEELVKTKVSVDGKEVYTDLKWVVAETKEDLVKVLNEAKTKKLDIQSQTSANTMTNNLNNAIDKFKNKMKDGLKERADTSNLVKAIERAKTRLDKIEQERIIVSANGYNVTKDKKWVTEAMKKALENAVEIATRILNDENTDTDTEILNAIERINQASHVFDQGMREGLRPDTTVLENVIDRATEVAKNLEVVMNADDSSLEDGVKYVLQQDYKALVRVKEAGISIMNRIDSNNSLVTQGNVDNASDNLEDAIQTFKEKIKTK